MSKVIVVDKSKLSYDDSDKRMPLVTLNDETYKEVTAITDATDKVNGGDAFDGLLVEGGMMKAMWDVWNGVRESFTLTLVVPTTGSVLLS